jgi:hypothetical protein
MRIKHITMDRFLKHKSLGPILFFAGITFIMTWPLGIHMRTQIIGSVGDNVYYVWLMGWFPKALFQYHINPLFVPFHNFPSGWSLAYTEITLANLVLGLPFTLMGGPIFGYNAALLLSFVLSGLIVYQFVFDITQDRPASLIAGMIFAFSPYRMAHINGHLPLMGTQWIVLHFLGMYHLLVKRDFSLKPILAAGIGLGLASLSSMYYLYMTLIMSLCFVGGYLVFINRRDMIRLNFWKRLLGAGITAFPFLLAALLPYLQLTKAGEANHRPFEEVDFWSASISDFFLPSPAHSLWGDWIARNFQAFSSAWVERYVYIGLITLLLMGFAIGSVKKREKAGQRRLVFWFLAMGLLSILLAMGTTLHWMNAPLLISPVPELLEKWYVTAHGSIPLPNYFLFKFLPFYNGMRVWERYGVYSILFASVLAGIGYSYLTISIKNKKWLLSVFVACALLIGIDFHIQPSLMVLKPRQVDLWLGSQPGNGSVAQFPIDQSNSPVYIYGSLFHNKPLLGMYFGAYLPANYKEMVPVLTNFPDPASVALLRQKNVEFIVLDTSKYPDWAKTWGTAKLLGLEQEVTLDNYLVLKVTKP